MKKLGKKSLKAGNTVEYFLCVCNCRSCTASCSTYCYWSAKSDEQTRNKEYLPQVILEEEAIYEDGYMATYHE